jgi:hypothetical protein
VLRRESGKVELPSKLGAMQLLAKMCGWLEPERHELLAFGDVGENAKHIAVTRRTVMAINSFVAEMTDRFLLGRDKALVEAFVKRLNLRHLPKLETFSIM